MPQAAQIFRIFVSSTFSDMKAERNALQERVFPRLRTLCLQHGARFQAIDLRWGVSEEASRDQQTLQICLSEIKHCQQTTPRPNFIILLGDRYGWCPLPTTIPVDEFEDVLRSLPPAEQGPGRQQSLLNRWYKRDDNAVPPVYCLLPREDRFRDYTNWEPEERELHATLHEAVKTMPLTPEQRLKYIASATEQEITHGAFRVADAQEHVFCALRTIRNVPGNSSARDFIDLDESGKPDSDARNRQDSLKSRLEERLPHTISRYEAAWTGSSITTDHIDELCENVYDNLSDIIREEMNRQETIDALDQEIAAHEDFGKERSNFFTGRIAILAAVGRYLEASNDHALAISGAAGSGKSALMAQAAQQARQAHPEAVNICRYIGITPGSSTGRSMLESLCRQLFRAYGTDHAPDPADNAGLEQATYEDLLKEIARRLAWATAQKPLMLFLDALDQLATTNNARDLRWLPVKLPPHVYVVVSTSMPGESVTVLESMLPSSSLLKLEPMSSAEGHTLLDLWLKGAQRSLQEQQRGEVLDRFTVEGLPLYLKLAFEEARRWTSYDKQSIPSTDIPGIIRNLFARLAAEANHGKVLVSHSLSYLAATKNGLSEDELLDILSGDRQVMANFRERSPKSPLVDQLPVVVWSRLYFDLKPYLTQRNADGAVLLSFYHRQLDTVVVGDYLTGEAKQSRHRSLAQYFQNQSLELQPNGALIPNLRKLSELPYQEAYSGQWAALRQTLTHFPFLDTKVRALGPQPLIEDYDLPFLVNTSSRAQDIQLDLLQVIQGAIRLSAHVLAQDGEQLAAQLLGRLLNYPSSDLHAFLTQVERERATPWLRPMISSLRPPGQSLQRTLLGHDMPVTSVVLTPDGRQAISADWNGIIKVWDLQSGTELRTIQAHETTVLALAVTAEGRQFISTSEDTTLKVWNLPSGTELRTLRGHSGSVTAVAVTSDGQSIISASADKSLKVWNRQSGIELRSIHAHEAAVWAVVVTEDNHQVVSASEDATIKVWHLQSGTELRTLRGHSEAITALALPDNQRVISSSYDRTLKLWDVQSGEELRTLQGHNGTVLAVAVTPDGRHAISASEDKTLKIWNLADETEPVTLTGHVERVTTVAAVDKSGLRAVSGSFDGELKVWDLQHAIMPHLLPWHMAEVTAVAVAPDGQHALSASLDKTLKLWDLHRGVEVRTLRGHDAGVTAVTILPNGRHAVSASDDMTLKVWDLENGEQIHTLRGHTASVRAVAVVPNSQLAISASYDATLKIWDLLRGTEVRTLSGHTQPFYAVAVTSEGRWAISGSVKILSIWDLESGVEVRTLEGHTAEISAVAVSPDGQQAISASNDFTLKVWDLVHGVEVRTLKGHTDFVRAVAMVPNRQLAISASWDTSIRVWNLESGEVIARFNGDDRLYACNIASDQGIIAAGSASGQIHILQLEK